jgi:hypothetical protein
MKVHEEELSALYIKFKMGRTYGSIGKVQNFCG